MLLNELAEASGVSVASIKYYRREGILPPGERITTTRAGYGQRHLERLRLVGVLREVAGASIADIVTLVRVLDDPDRPLVDALEIAQALASGLPAGSHGRPVPADEDPFVREVLAELGWPDVSTGPRAALDELLREMRAGRLAVRRDVVLRYARLLGELAQGDLDDMRRRVDAPPADGTDGADGAGGFGPRPDDGDGDGDLGPAAPSDDVAVSRAVTGMVTYERLARILRALGHASLSMTAPVTPSDDAVTDGP